MGSYRNIVEGFYKRMRRWGRLSLIEILLIGGLVAMILLGIVVFKLAVAGKLT